MRAAWALVVAAGCGATAGPVPPSSREVPRLLPPAALDLRAPGAAYLTSVAVQLQPDWGQFLADCRLRLPASHPLNAMTLAATAELVIDPAGRLAAARIATPSGSADFDRAVTDVLADVHELGAPPPELLADDDRVHLRWLFARDRRQAGPATAALVPLQLPLATVVPRLLERGELARAAHRIAEAPAGPERAAATTRAMVAALGEALASADDSARRDAIAAIARARATELAPRVRALLAETSDAELRAEAVAAAGALGDTTAAPQLVQDLARDLAAQPALVLAETRALVALGDTADAAAVIAAALAGPCDRALACGRGGSAADCERCGGRGGAAATDCERCGGRGAAAATDCERCGGRGAVAVDCERCGGRGAVAAEALAAFAVAPTPGLVPRLAARFAHADAPARAALCVALAHSEAGPATLAAGLRDGDATVRASCADVARTLGAPAARFVPRLAELARDRDRNVRALAVGALAALDPARPLPVDDAAPRVRATCARALGSRPPRIAEPMLRVLIDDRDPDVRAAAWSSLAALPPGAIADLDALALRAGADSAPQVRLAAVAALADDAALVRLAGDAAPEVRGAALARLVARRGRATMEGPLLARLAAAPPASGERVRIALAWLLASDR